jgi:hypothetical protein
MDYAEQTKTGNLVSSFTYFEYLKLKRKPPKVETKPETTRTRIGLTFSVEKKWLYPATNPPAYRRDHERTSDVAGFYIQPTRV